MLDTCKNEKEFCFRAKTGLEEGLKKTIKWFVSTSPEDLTTERQ